MPNTKHQRHPRHKEEDAHNNNEDEMASAPHQQPREVVPPPQGHAMAHGQRENDNHANRLQKCCTPEVCVSTDESIDPQDPYDAVKVICNNENCDVGNWMHKDCFDNFQQSVLAYLRSCGRARSWSEKQRLQNLWTKKGYDLAFKACDCRCGRGHLRKDLDYIQPPITDNAKRIKKHKKKNDKPMPVVSTAHKNNSHSSHVGHASNPVSHGPQGTGHASGRVQQQVNHAGSRNKDHPTNATTATHGKQKHTKTSSTSPTTKIQDITILHKNDNSAVQQSSGCITVDNHPNGSSNNINNNGVQPTTSSSGENVNHILANNNQPFFGLPPGNSQLRLRTNSMSSTGSVGSHSSSISSVPSSAGSISPISSSPVSGDMFFKGTRKASDSSASDSGLVSGPTSIHGFRQRLDLSAFACLPRSKQNPYHIRMEDSSSLAFAFSLGCSIKGGPGQPYSSPLWDLAGLEEGSCDVETRNFVLSNLLNKRMCSTRCALCKTHLPVFDRFPLIDGTFFLSPQSYDEAAIQVIWEGRLQFLNAACLACLEGRNEVKCVACKRSWDGSNLVIGSMYTYDIFAAVPCCQKRLTCKCCRRAVVDITQGLDFYSQYSHMIICPYCKANDYHFIRSLGETFILADGEGEVMGPICH